MAIPLLFALRGKRWPARAALGFVWGLLAYGALVWWLAPLSWAGYIVFVIALAVQGAVFGLLTLKSGTHRIFQTRECGKIQCVPFSLRAGLWPGVYTACAWVVSEYVRNMLLGGFTWGLGYSQAPVPEMIQFARFGGVYAVSWPMVFFAAWNYGDTHFNYGDTHLIQHGIKRKELSVCHHNYLVRWAMVPVAVWLVGYALMAMDRPSTEKPLRVALVQADISRPDKMDDALYDRNIERHLALSRLAARGAENRNSKMEPAVELLVWPETAFSDDLMRDPVWRPRMEAEARTAGAYFLVGSALLSDDGHDLNALLLLTPQGKWKDVYYKRRLVPFSEYQPTGVLSGLLARVSGMQSYSFLPGRRAGLFRLDRRNAVVGAAVCSEEAYPALFRDLARKNAGLFVSVLNDGWFARPEALMLHARMAVFRAVEFARPLARAANTGWTGVIDGRGRIFNGPALRSAGWMSAEVQPEHGRTFYGIFGDVFVWLCALFVIIKLLVRATRCRDTGHLTLDT